MQPYSPQRITKINHPARNEKTNPIQTQFFTLSVVEGQAPAPNQRHHKRPTTKMFHGSGTANVAQHNEIAKNCYPKKIRIFSNFSKFFLTLQLNVLIFINMRRKLLSTSCPSCGLPMQTAAMACAACGVKIEGNFSETFLGRLPPEDQEFLEQYLLAGFSIKMLEQRSSLGYAAIRSRLDRLIANYKALKKMDAQKKAVLEQLRKDKISVTEAKEKLEKLAGD